MPHRFTSEISTDLPLIGIDLGYSTRNPSCGLARSTSRATESLQFGECITRVAAHLKAHGPHVLIIEAVLSTYHRPDGNPDIRGEFEKGRGWYYGPGVSTFAAALRFLKSLDEKLPTTLEIPIVEGFLSYKPTRTTHTSDAIRLVDEFETAERFQPDEESEPISPLVLGTPQVRRYNKPPAKKIKV
jgi:hypothetical protein